MAVLITFIGDQSAVMGSAPAEWGYAYIDQHEKPSNTVKIYAFRPDRLSEPVMVHEIKHTTESGYFGTFIALSPNGEYIAGAARLNSSYEIRIVSLRTGALETILDVENMWGVGGLGLSDYPDVFMEWSPDSQKLAYYYELPSPIDARIIRDIWVYDLSTKRNFNLSPDRATQYRIAWDPQSYRIATISTECTPKCTNQIDIFSVPDRWIADSARITALDSPLGLEVACLLAWSPDGRFLLYRVNCNTPTWGYFQEMFVYDTEFSKALRLTYISQAPPIPDDPSIRFLSYAPLWIGPTKLLLGVRFLYVKIPNDGSLKYEKYTTVLYDVGTKSVMPVASDYAFQWAANPKTGDLAFRTENAAGFAFAIGRFDGKKLTYRTLGDGCFPSWDPSGRYLMYRVQAPSQSNNCSHISTGLRFLDVQNNTAVDYPFDEGYYLKWLGWVRIPAP